MWGVYSSYFILNRKNFHSFIIISCYSMYSGSMYEKSFVKKDLLKVLMEWDYNKHKATPHNIAIEINASESSVMKILRYMRDIKLAESSRGSWHLV